MNKENENHITVFDENITLVELESILKEKLREAPYGTMHIFLVKNIDTTVSFFELEPLFEFTVIQSRITSEIDVWHGSISDENIGRQISVTQAAERIFEYVTLMRTGVVLACGITECCGYDFGSDAFVENKPKFCPMCGKKIIKYE